MKSGVLLSSNLRSVIDRSNLSPSRLGDKFDRSMARGKLIDNNTTLLIFYFYSYDDPRDPKKQTTEPILGTAILGKKQLQPVECESVAYCSSTEHYPFIMPNSCPLT